MRLLVCMLATSCLVACSAKDELKLSVPHDASPQAKQLLAESWPKVKQACPGFDRFAKDLQVAEVNDYLASVYPGTPKLTVRVKVADDPSTIPSSWRAWGHSCYVDITPDGKSISIVKDPCISVCQEREIDNGGRNLILPL